MLERSNREGHDWDELTNVLFAFKVGATASIVCHWLIVAKRRVRPKCVSCVAATVVALVTPLENERSKVQSWFQTEEVHWKVNFPITWHSDLREFR